MDRRTAEQFEFIELVLAYEGTVANQRLRERFDISGVQASRILASYRESFPDNLELKTGLKKGRYTPSETFQPAIAELSIDRYFAVARPVDADVPVEDIRQDFATVTPNVFRQFHIAIRQRSALQVEYRSMSHPEGLSRVLHPHAFVFAGRRWHVRAFDEHSEEHRDFNLSRIAKITETNKSRNTPPDNEWEERVHLLIRPHPDLTTGQAQLIRDELFSGAAARQITTRKALTQYVLRDLEIAVDPASQRPPEFQLVLARTELAE